MGFFKSLQQKRKETKAYRNIVASKTKLAARQAYAEEAVKVAKERARAKARQPTFGQKLGMVAKNVARPKPQVRAKSYKTTGSSKKKKKYPAAPSLNQVLYGGY